MPLAVTYLLSSRSTATTATTTLSGSSWGHVGREGASWAGGGGFATGKHVAAHDPSARPSR